MPPNPLWDRKPSNSRPAVDNNELSAASAPDHTAGSHAPKMLGINGSSLRDPVSCATSAIVEGGSAPVPNAVSYMPLPARSGY